MTEVQEESRSAEPVHDGSVATATVLLCMPSVSAEGLLTIVNELKDSFQTTNFVVASCNQPSDSIAFNGRVKMVEYPPQPSHAGWVLTAPDYLSAATLATEHQVTATLLLGSEATTLNAEALRTLCAAALEGGGDLVLPRYHVGPHEGLLSAALLHPLSRALYGIDARMPLPFDVAFSARMAAKLSVAAKRPSSVPGSEPILWPASEAAVASFVIHEIHAGQRTLPQPGVDDLNTLLAQIAGSFFADAEAKATFWQRSRVMPTATRSAAAPSRDMPTQSADQVQQMAADFRNAFTNLQDIWSLVLPPQSVVALRKLSVSSSEAFTMPANLWARTVYDFVMAYRLRTINRGHLLGALTPLYLAWVASHLRIAGDDRERAEQHIEETSAAFVAEKPYIVSRWRWPDRFNP